MDNLKSNVQKFKINFKNKFKEYRKKPSSKRKSFIIGFTTILGIFSLTLFGPALYAVAKELPKSNPRPTDIPPSQVPVSDIVPSKTIINNGLSGLTASICALAITSGSFAFGVACVCLVVIGLLHMQAK
jgi:hypothetical protein